MPDYQYICGLCNHSLVQYEPMNKKRRVKCPNCKKHKLYVDCSGVTGSVIGEPTNLGHLAERNTAKFGKYQLEDKKEALASSKLKKKKKAPKPIWRDTDKIDKRLFNLDETQKKDYILDGKLPPS